MWYAQLVCTVLLGPEVAHLRQLIWGVRTPLPQAMSSKAQASKPVTTAAAPGLTPKLHFKQTSSESDRQPCPSFCGPPRCRPARPTRTAVSCLDGQDLVVSTHVEVSCQAYAELVAPARARRGSLGLARPLGMAPRDEAQTQLQLRPQAAGVVRRHQRLLRRTGRPQSSAHGTAHGPRRMARGPLGGAVPSSPARTADKARTGSTEAR